ncbi:diguanylate cyclase [Deinococcus sp. KSM4-11]|uniref:diguanylate cyclase n=1 Tax=Deinococcus sp. KSM4-11 TaxID=2568654 RepID=UPI001454C425|nr:diguanylate cyclase [Deinococcus sp. KSM4-11]
MPLRRVLFLLQVPLWCMLLASFGFLLRALDARVQATTQATQTRTQLETLNGLLLHALDMETGVRGYVIAGNVVFLDPYHEARRALPDDFRTLRAQLGSDRAAGYALDVAGVDRVQQLLTRWQTEVAVPEIVARRSSAEAAALIVSSQRGKKLLDAVRVEIRVLSARQTTRLKQREAQAVYHLRVLRVALYGAGGALLLLSVVTTLTGAGVLIRPLHALTGAARRISGGETLITVPAGGPLELRTLAQTFNAMSEQLHVARQEADAYALDLARRNEWRVRMGRLSDAMQAARSLDEGAVILARALPDLLPGTRGTLLHQPPERDGPVPLLTWGEDVQGDQGQGALPGVGGDATVCSPLISQGETLGELHVDTGLSGGAWTDEGRTRLLTVTRQVTIALASLGFQERLLQQSVRDPLTGLYNRRRLEEDLHRAVDDAVQGGTPLSVIALDIDHFKRLNDTFGHDAGDAALVQVSATLRDLAPRGSTPARPGGEEFTLLLPGHDLLAAEGVAERLRGAVEALTLTHAGEALGPVTVSLGVADHTVFPFDAATLMSTADHALYAAKHRGRNRVVSTRTLRATSRDGSGQPDVLGAPERR